MSHVPQVTVVSYFLTSSPLLLPFLQRQELLQQQAGLDALAAASGGVAGMPPLRNDPALGRLGSPARRGAASLTRPPLSLDNAPNLSSFAEKYQTTSSLLGSSMVPQANPDGLPLASELGREGLGGLSAHHRALLDRRLLLGEDSALAAAAGLGGSTGTLQGGSLLSMMNPVSLPRSSADMMGSQLPMSGDSIRQAVFRERAIAAATEARLLGAPETNPYEAPSKRLRKSF